MTRRLAGKKLVLATHNQGKLDEMRALLGATKIEIVGAAELGLDEPEETGTTFLENARLKAHAAARKTGLPALSDDSGISIDALGGKPGVYTADWAETPNGRDFRLAMERANRELDEIGAPMPRTAQFNCTLVLAWPDGEDSHFEGIVRGQLVWPWRGKLGHGYDPVFQPDGHEMTFAEMDPAEKNKISHRARALAAFVESCVA